MATTPEHAPHLPHIRLPDIKGAARWVQTYWKPVGLSLAATALGLTGYFMATSQEGNTQAPIKPTTGVSDTFKPAEPGSDIVIPAIPTEAPPTATASPTPEPPTPIPTVEPTPTVESTKTPATPEAKKDVPCFILPQEYCSQAELVERQTALGLTAKMIAISVPAGESLTMPIAGQVAKTKLNDDVIFYKGYRAVVFDPNNPMRKYIITGDFQFDDMLSRNMKKDEVFGRTNNTGVEMLGYNFIFYVADIGPDNREIVNEEVMKKMFPAAYAKPPKQAAASEGTPKKGGSININTFYNAPPK